MRIVFSKEVRDEVFDEETLTLYLKITPGMLEAMAENAVGISAMLSDGKILISKEDFLAWFYSNMTNVDKFEEIQVPTWEEIFTREECARFMKVSPETIDRWCKYDGFPYFSVWYEDDSGWTPRFSRYCVMKWFYSKIYPRDPDRPKRPDEVKCGCFSDFTNERKGIYQ